MKKRKKWLSGILVAMIITTLVPATQTRAADSDNALSSKHYTKSISSDSIALGKKGKTTECKKRIDKYITMESRDALVSKQISSGGIVENHEAQVVYEIQEEIFDDPKVCLSNPFVLSVEASETGSQSRSKTDSAGTIKVTSNISYSFTTYRGRDYIKITKATGKLTSLGGYSGSYQGSNIYIVGNKVIVGQMGPKKDGTTSSKTWSKTLSNKPCSYSANVDGWPYTGYDTSSSIVAINCSHTVKLKRGNSTWTLKMTNTVL